MWATPNPKGHCGHIDVCSKALAFDGSVG